MKVLLIAVLIIAHMGLSIITNGSFRQSAGSSDWRGYWLWQLIGNTTGFLGVQALTNLMRFLPLHIAYPVTQGLAVIGVQIFAARWIFRESIGPLQWIGTLLVVAGIILISLRQAS